MDLSKEIITCPKEEKCRSKGMLPPFRAYEIDDAVGDFFLHYDNGNANIPDWAIDQMREAWNRPIHLEVISNLLAFGGIL